MSDLPPEQSRTNGGECMSEVRIASAGGGIVQMVEVKMNIEMVHGEWVCPFCDFSCHTLQHMQRHIKEMHPEKNFRVKAVPVKNGVKVVVG